MNDLFSERHEQEMHERYLRSERHPRDPEEEQAFRIYERIDEQIQSVPLDEIDKTALKNRLVKELAGYDARSSHPSFFRIWRIRPAWAAIGMCFIIVLLIGWSLLFTPPIKNSVQSVQFILAQSEETQSPPYFWKWKLIHGTWIIVPPQKKALITLPCGSTLSCTSGSLIAIPKEKGRFIAIQSGSMTIKAAEIPGSPITVQTPYADIVVVGTEFQVNIIQKNE